VVKVLTKKKDNSRTQIEIVSVDQLVPEDHLVRKIERATRLWQLQPKNSISPTSNPHKINLGTFNHQDRYAKLLKLKLQHLYHSLDIYTGSFNSRKL